MDSFKEVNDTYGHLVGDAVLRAVADCLARASCASTTRIGRFGGEEFVAMLPDVDYRPRGGHRRAGAGPRSASWRCPAGTRRQAGRGRPLRLDRHWPATPSTAPTLEDLLHAADSAVYLAKHAGRNRVAFAGEPPGEVARVRLVHAHAGSGVRRWSLCGAAWATGLTTARSMLTCAGRVATKAITSATSSAVSGSATPS